MRIGCLQFAPQLGDVDNNLNRADAVLNRADPEALDLLVLPELAFSGYNFESLRDIMPYLEPSGSGITSLWARTTALKHDCTVVAGYPEKVDVAHRWPSSPEYYNAALTVNEDGETVANYRKTHLFYTDERWALESPKGFYRGFLPGLGQTAMGICMDINPYKFEASWQAYEFANHVLESDADLVIIPMAWTTQEDYSDFTSQPLEPNWEAFNYWVSRLDPLVRARGKDEIIVVFANRTGIEGDTMYAGTSAVIGIQAGIVNVYGILGRGTKELLVVDTEDAPIAQLAFQRDINDLGLTPEVIDDDEEEEWERPREPNYSPDDDVIFSPDADEPTVPFTASFPRMPTHGIPESLNTHLEETGLIPPPPPPPPSSSRRMNPSTSKLEIPATKPRVHFGESPNVESPIGPSPTPSRLRPKVGFDEVKSMREEYLASTLPALHPMTPSQGLDNQSSQLRSDEKNTISDGRAAVNEPGVRRQISIRGAAKRQDRIAAERVSVRPKDETDEPNSAQSFKTDSSVISGHVGSSDGDRPDPFKLPQLVSNNIASTLSSPDLRTQQGENGNYDAVSGVGPSRSNRNQTPDIPVGLSIYGSQQFETPMERASAMTPGPEDFRKTPRPRSPTQSVDGQLRAASPLKAGLQNRNVDRCASPVPGSEAIQGQSATKIIAREAWPAARHEKAGSPFSDHNLRAGCEIARPSTATGVRAAEAGRSKERVAAWFATEGTHVTGSNVIRKAASSQRLRAGTAGDSTYIRYGEELPLSSFKALKHGREQVASPPPQRPATANSTQRPPSRQQATSPPLGTGAFERVRSPPQDQRSRGFSDLRQPELVASPPYSVPEFSRSLETLVTSTEGGGSIASPRRLPPTPADPQTPKAMMLFFSEDDIHLPAIEQAAVEGGDKKALPCAAKDTLDLGLDMSKSRGSL